MNPIEQLISELLNCGKQVISVKYVTDRLRLIEREDRAESEHLTKQSTKAV